MLKLEGRDHVWEVHDDGGDVVPVVALELAPIQRGLGDEEAAGVERGQPLVVKLADDGDGLVVVDELPHAIGGEDEELVRRLHRMHADLGSGDEPAPVSLEVAEAARDAQPGPQPRLALGL